MCWGKTKIESPTVVETPTTEAAPEISPAPSPTPTKIESASIPEERRRKIQQVRYGMMSTIKTSPRGITGTGADLTAKENTKKKTLGE